MIAVGTALTGRPPHRSVREELPHTAPPLGPGDQSSTRRAHLSHACHRRCLARSGAASGTSKTGITFPLGVPLSSTGSVAGVPVLFVRIDGTMGTSDFLSAFMSTLPSLTFSDRSARRRTRHSAPRKPTGSPGSRAWSFQACSGSSTPPCRSPTCHGRVAFPQPPQGRRTKRLISEFNSWPACTSRRCHTRGVTAASVRSEAGVTG